MLRLSKVLAPSHDLVRLLRLPKWWRHGAPSLHRTARFDPRTAPDHLKRDLGLSDVRAIKRGR